jgi:hypothetical protein
MSYNISSDKLDNTLLMNILIFMNQKSLTL